MLLKELAGVLAKALLKCSHLSGMCVVAAKFVDHSVGSPCCACGFYPAHRRTARRAGRDEGRISTNDALVLATPHFRPNKAPQDLRWTLYSRPISNSGGIRWNRNADTQSSWERAWPGSRRLVL